ncbi:hypothetical protein CGCSCA1_v007143 [Colletotrichum siamense]|nr:hypothetical protein CGCSCA1_v007143 [Colletotrichum siamense]
MPTTRRLGPPSTFERAWIVDIDSVWVSPAHTGAQRPPDFKPRLRYTVAQGEPSAENTLLRDLCQDLPALPGPLAATCLSLALFQAGDADKLWPLPITTPAWHPLVESPAEIQSSFPTEGLPLQRPLHTGRASRPKMRDIRGMAKNEDRIPSLDRNSVPERRQTVAKR